MPIRSSRSSVLRWPARSAVLEASRAWAGAEAPRHTRRLRLGVFGSAARGDWGVGSDLDLIAIVAESISPFMERALGWDLIPLPVPAEIVVYTQAEWDALRSEGGAFREDDRARVPVDLGGRPTSISGQKPGQYRERAALPDFPTPVDEDPGPRIVAGQL